MQPVGLPQEVIAGAAVEPSAHCQAFTVRQVQNDAEADTAGRICETAYFADGFIEEEYRPTLRDGRSRA